jgi:predicted N-acetyltransferase YhbS
VTTGEPLAVRPDHQGRGIGGALVETALRAAAERGALVYPGVFLRHDAVGLREAVS